MSKGIDMEINFQNTLKSHIRSIQEMSDIPFHESPPQVSTYISSNQGVAFTHKLTLQTLTHDEDLSKLLRVTIENQNASGIVLWYVLKPNDTHGDFSHKLFVSTLSFLSLEAEMYLADLDLEVFEKVNSKEEILEKTEGLDQSVFSS